MKKYLLDTFAFNDVTNQKLVDKIRLLNNPEEAIKLFSHLINSQFKWMVRITHDPKAPTMSWWDPVYQADDLIKKWKESLIIWIDYISKHEDEELMREVNFTGLDGAQWAATPADIALQLNYHSIHHRAQIQTILRQQGIEPDFVDYIGTKYRKLTR